MKNKLLAVAGFISLSLSFASGAGAALYEYVGVVEVCPNDVIPCINGTFAVGDPFTGSFLIHDSVIEPDSSFNYLGVLSYELTLGPFSFDTDSTDLVQGVVETDSAGNLVGGFFHIYADEVPDTPLQVITLDLETGTWSLLAWTMPNPEYPFLVATGTGAFTQVIPVPGALGLFASAMALMGVVRRRRSLSPVG